MNPRTLVLILSCCALAGSIQLRAFDPLLVSIARDLEVEIATVMLLPAAYATAFGFVQLALGPISDAVGKTIVIRLSLAILALFTLAAALAGSFEYMLLCRILAGLAAGGIVPVCFAIASERLSEEHRRGAINQIISFSVTGQMLASAAAGILAGSIGWRWMLVIWAVLIAAAAAGAAHFLGRAKQPAPRASSFGDVLSQSQSAFARVMSDRRMRPPLLVCYLNAILTVGLIPFISTTLTQASGEKTAGFAVALFAAGGLANSGVSRALGKRLATRAYLVAGICISAFGLAIVSVLPFWAFILLPAIVGVGFYMTQSSLTVLFGAIGEHQSGTAVSIFMFTFFLGQASGPILWSFVQTAFGSYGVCVLAASGLALLALLSRGILPIDNAGNASD